jgi:hypothetical protein
MRGETRREAAGSLLVTEPGVGAAEADRRDTSAVVAVAYDADAEPWLERWGGESDRVAVVSAGERTRGAAATTPGAEPISTTVGVVETVPDPTDVAAVGEVVHEYLSAWESGVTVYVDGLADVVDETDVETAFRFAHVLLARAEHADARVVASFDRDAYPRHVVATFAELFEDVRD